jgi:hypothetical protein
VFWISNLASPWLSIAFLSGRVQRSRICATLSAIGCEIACVIGFYGQFLLNDYQRGPRGRGGSILTILATNLSGWLVFIAPWVAIAIAAGFTYGLLGWWRGRSMSAVAGALAAVPFLIEPWIWRNILGYSKGSWAPWIGELAIGVAISVWVLVAWRREQSLAVGSR